MIKKLAAILTAALIAVSASAVFAEGELSSPSAGSETYEEERVRDVPTAEENAAYAERMGQATAAPEEQKLIEQGAEAIENGTQEEFVEEHFEEINDISESSGGVAATAVPQEAKTITADPVNIFVWCFVGAIVIAAVAAFIVTTRKSKKK